VSAIRAATATPRRRPRRRVLYTVEAVVLALAAAFLILGRAGFVGSPISYVVVSGHSMEPGLHTGDVVVLRRAGSYHPGEVVGYEVPKGQPGAGLIVIHRIVGGSARDGFLMRGDNNPSPDPWNPRASDVVGHELLMVPKLGLWVSYLRTPLGIALLAALVTTAIALGGAGGETRSPETGSPDARRAPSGGTLRRRSPSMWEGHGSRKSASSASASAAPSASAASGRRRRSSRGRRAGQRSTT
jgi:signal peptidase